MSHSSATVRTSRNALEEFCAEIADIWRRLPNKDVFLILLGAWVVLFQFLGNSTLGYRVHSASLFEWMWFTYETPENAHGKLIPLVVLILFWIKRKDFDGLPVRLWPVALVGVFMAVGLHVLGYRVQQPRVSIVALFLGVYSLMGLAWGPAALRKSFFPFFLFVFCMPFDTLEQPISFPLRLLVSKLVVWFSNWVLGLHVLREGTQLFNANHSYSYDVAAACSGLHSLIATTAIATIYAWVALRTLGKRLLLILCGVPLAVLGNSFRLLVIILVSEFAGYKAGMAVHNNTWFSLLPYIPAFIGLFAIGQWMEGTKPKKAPHLADAPAYE